MRLWTRSSTQVACCVPIGSVWIDLGAQKTSHIHPGQWYNEPMNYDVIGDIHGQADKLEALLRHLGYRRRGGAYRHPDRTALFAGDFVDRGPGQIATLQIVHPMCEAGSAEAVMGNHEFNGIAWHTPDPLAEGLHLRVRTERNRRQHHRFLEEVGEDSVAHREWIEWFMTLPLWLEKPGLRLVHACWHPQHMETLKPLLGPNNTLTPALVEAASRKGSMEYEAVEALCKGLEIQLPEPISYTDQEGTVRTRTRVRWWDESATTYRSAALMGFKEANQLPDIPLPPNAQVAYDQEKPVFFGHYWLTGTPRVLSPRACCVDYSAARDGHPLVAYRWDGEPDLVDEHLVAVLPEAIITPPRLR